MKKLTKYQVQQNRQNKKITQIRSWEKDLGFAPYNWEVDELDEYYNHLYNEIYAPTNIYSSDF